MGVALFLFIVSLIGIMILLSPNRFFRNKTSFFAKSDAMILGWIKNGKTFISFFNKKTMKLFFHFVLEEIELLFEKGFRRLKSFVRKP